MRSRTKRFLKRHRWTLCYLATLLAAAAAGTYVGYRAAGRNRARRRPRQEETPAQLRERIRVVVVGHTAAPSRWRYIVVHHSATSRGNAEIFDRYHREQRHWDRGLAYHFVIGNGTDSADGEVEISRRWKLQQAGAHCGDVHYNNCGIGICVVGNFETTRPTHRQMVTLLELCRQLCARHDIPVENVIGHKEVPGAATKCPGANLDMKAVRSQLGE